MSQKKKTAQKIYVCIGKWGDGDPEKRERASGHKKVKQK